MSISGIVYLVGAGPGDPDLVTRKAERLIRSCDALVYDYLASEEIREWAKPGCAHICVGKRAGYHSVPQPEIEQILVRLAVEGKSVVRLKGGDPFVFGRGGEEAATLKKAGIRYEIVPGVTAALGCAAYAGVPLTDRRWTRAVTFISGHERIDHPEDDRTDWSLHARSGATLVLYMAMGRLSEISVALIQGGRAATEPVIVIERGTTRAQRCVTGTLATIVESVKASGIGAPAVVIVGSVAGMHEELAWFDQG